MTQPKENTSMDFCSLPVRRRPPPALGSPPATAFGSSPLKDASASASADDEKKRSGAK